MKYIMMQTREGQKLPFIFPDAVTHLVMAEVMNILLKSFHKTSSHAVSAGFVELGLDVTVNGESESLGGLKSVPADAARIMVGSSVAFMPDAVAAMMLTRLQMKAQLADDEGEDS